MSWRVIATLIIVVFAAVIVWSVTADPLRQTGDAFKDVDDGGGEYDITAQIDSKIRGYSNMFIILIFGIAGWGAWRVMRKELTRGGL